MVNRAKDKRRLKCTQAVNDLDRCIGRLTELLVEVNGKVPDREALLTLYIEFANDLKESIDDYRINKT